MRIIPNQPESNKVPDAWALFCEQYGRATSKDFEAGPMTNDSVRHAWIWFLSGWVGRAPNEAGDKAP